MQSLLQNPTVYTAFFTAILDAANKELNNVSRRTELSVLRNRGCDGMSSAGWMDEVIGELSS